MKHILAIDPGNKTGWAIFYDGFLDVCGVWSKDLMLGWKPPLKFDMVIIEEPQAYQGRRAKGKPQDILDLAIYVGKLEEHFRPFTKSIKSVKPARWKGQLDKKLCHARAKAKLSERELGIVEVANLDHNGMDAVALGLWALGR